MCIPFLVGEYRVHHWHGNPGISPHLYFIVVVKEINIVAYLTWSRSTQVRREFLNFAPLLTAGSRSAPVGASQCALPGKTRHQIIYSELQRVGSGSDFLQLRILRKRMSPGITPGWSGKSAQLATSPCNSFSLGACVLCALTLDHHFPMVLVTIWKLPWHPWSMIQPQSSHSHRVFMITK